MSLLPNYLEEDKNAILLQSQDIYIYEDKTETQTIEEILKLSDTVWTSQKDRVVAIIPNIDRVYWVHLKPKELGVLEGKQLLEILDSHVNSLTAFCVEGDRIIKYNPIGIDYHFKERAYLHKNFVFTIPETEKEVDFYFRYQTRFQSALLFKIWHTADFLNYSNGEYYLLGVFYGILILLAVYNLFFFFSLRESFYLYYVFFVLSCVFVGFVEDRTGFQYYWENFPMLNAISDTWTPLYFMVSFVLFSNAFLKIRKHYKLGWYMICTSVLLNILFFIADYGTTKFLWTSPIYILPFVLTYVVTIMIQRKRNIQGRYFLIGYTFVLIAVGILSLRAQGVAVFYSILGVYMFNFSLLLKVIFFSIALADRYRVLKKTNEVYQQTVIDQLRENEKMIEQKVVERTEQLKQQSEIIESNNKELASANAMLEGQAEQLKRQSLEIERMNELLRGENIQLQENVEELATARVLVKDVGFSEFSKIFPDDESCYKYLAKLKWKDGYTCKKCGNEKYSESSKHGLRCTKCGFNESTTNATIFHRLHFPIQKAFYMLYLVYSHQGDITSTELSTLLDLRQNTCWKFGKKIKDRLAQVKENTARGWESLIED